MLVLTRGKNEAILIGSDIRIEVLDVAGGGRQVRLGITAPRATPIFREEIYRAVESENERSAGASADSVAAAAELLAQRRDRS